MKIAIITDSSCNLTKEEIDACEDLYVLPLVVSIDNKPYRDQIEISSEEVYKNIDKPSIKTSLPPMEDVEYLFEQLVSKGYTDVYILPISSKLSGTANSIRLISNNFTDKLNILATDSLTLSYTLGFLVLEAVEKAKTCKSLVELDMHVKSKSDSCDGYFTVDNLKYLQRGGRIGKISYAIANILNIKPIIHVDNGEYVSLSKKRSFKQACVKIENTILEKYKNKKVNLTIQYCDNLDVANEIAERCKGLLNINDIKLVQLTPVLGVHTGPKTIAYSIIEI